MWDTALIRGVTRSRATISREIKLDDITRRVKKRSREICELSKLLFVACGGSNAPLLRLACQNLTKEKEKRIGEGGEAAIGSQNDVGKYPYYRRRCPRHF